MTEISTCATVIRHPLHINVIKWDLQMHELSATWIALIVIGATLCPMGGILLYYRCKRQHPLSRKSHLASTRQSKTLRKQSRSDDAYIAFDLDDEAPVPHLGRIRDQELPMESSLCSTATTSFATTSHSPVSSAQSTTTRSFTLPEEAAQVPALPEATFSTQLGKPKVPLFLREPPAELLESTRSIELLAANEETERANPMLQSTNSVDFLYPNTNDGHGIPCYPDSNRSLYESSRWIFDTNALLDASERSRDAILDEPPSPTDG